MLYFLSFYIFFNKERLNVINFEGKEELALICLYFLSFYIFFNKESLNVINFEGKEELALKGRNIIA